MNQQPTEERTECIVKKWHWIRHRETNVRFFNVSYDGEKVTAERAKDDRTWRDVEVNEVDLLNAVNAVIEHDKRKRSEAAKKAAETRALRKTQKYQQIIRYLKRGGALSPAMRCRICGKSLTDEPSRKRGIGPECYGTLLEYLAQDQPLDSEHVI